MVKQMPSSIEAEQALLGALILFSQTIEMAVEEDLREDDFYLDSHRKIYRVISELHEENRPTDFATLSSKLKDLNLLNVVGGNDYLMQLIDLAVTSASTKSYIEIIQKKAYARRLIETAEKIAEDGFNGSIEIDDLLDSAEKRVLDVTRNRKAGEFKSTKEVVSNVLINIQKMSEQKSNITGIATGYEALDKTTSGFQRGDLIILAARPSVGKTAFALNCGLKVALKNPGAVAIFSLEMPAEQLASRMLSALSMVPGQKLRIGKLNNQEWNQLNEAAMELKGTKMFIDDSSGVKVSEIFSKCRKLQAEHGLSLIIIDYIQLITGSGKSSDNRQQEVSEISRGLKQLARELNVPVIALSQLSRSVEKREDKRPMLSDLRESGSIEQDADIVMFLYRDDYYNRDKDESQKREEVEVNIAKHRNGPTRLIKLAFEREINAFYGIVDDGME